MVETFFVHVEAGLQVEDRLAVLDRDHAPGGERLAVADAVDLIEDRRVRVSSAQEVRVQRVDEARRPIVGLVLDCARRGDQRLPGDLSPEHSLTLLVG